MTARPPEPPPEPRRIPFLLCIDVEPDDGEIPRRTSEPWRGFERMLEVVHGLRPRWEDATGMPVHLTWVLRMDPQVASAYGSPRWAVDRYGRQIEDLRSRGDALGIHPHAWRWDDERSIWIADHGNASWVEDCLRSSLDAFHGSLGRCEIHKFGSHYISRGIVDLLRELGIRYDLTVEPGAPPRQALGPEAATGRLPDYEHAPRHPYRPDPADPIRPARVGGGAASSSDDLWCIPHTAFDPDPLLPTWRRVARRLRHPTRSRVRPILLSSPLDPQLMWRVIETRLARSRQPFLSFSLRSDAPLRDYWQLVQAKLDALLDDPILERLVFETPAELIGRVNGVEPAGAASRP